MRFERGLVVGSLLLDFPIDGVFPFHSIDNDSYIYGARFSPRLKYDANPEFRLVVSPAFQMGSANGLTATGLRYFRDQPDTRLALGHFNPGNQDIRLDIPEAYLQFRPSNNVQIRIGRNYWDNTLQRRMRDWSFEGFTDGNIGDAPISLGAGGDVRLTKKWQRAIPARVDLSASGAVGARKEALGLVQGIVTFLPVESAPDSVTVIGGSLGYSHYPQGALAELLPGVSANAAGDGISGSLYLQQGFGRSFDLRVGYGAFIPTSMGSETNAVPLGERRGLTVTADYQQRYWGVHATYGKVWRNDLENRPGTQTEDLFGVSGRFMLLGEKNRNINLSLGTTFAKSADQFRFGVFAGLEIALQDIHLR